MKTLEFLTYLRQLNIELWAENDKLRYRAPKGALTPALRGELNQRKGAILDFLHDAQTAVGNGHPALRPRSRSQSVPLSFAQQRLWFLAELAPGAAAYLIPLAIRLQGKLDTCALQQALDTVIQRHETLRTTFTTDANGEPVQVIAPTLSLDWHIVDLRHLPPAERDEKADHLIQEEAQRAFDLAHGPLLRASLLQLDATTYIILLTMHHIISDGWSMGILLQELITLYMASLTNGTVSLPDLPVQYADYALWQREWLQGEIMAEQLAYWQRTLAGVPDVLSLPTDQPRPPVQTFRGEVAVFQLSAAVSRALHQLSQAEEVTLFMTLLTAFNLFLYRYSGQADVVVGSPVAGRNRAEIEGLIGFFVNTLVLRTNLSGNPSFRTLLAQVREVVLTAQTHQDIPFEKLVEVLKPQRTMSHSPLFQVMFAYQANMVPPVNVPGFELTPLTITNQTAKFDLTLSFSEDGGRLSGALEYNVDLFAPDTVQRMVTHLQRILTAAATNPDQRLHDLPLLTAVERQQLLITWNDTQTPYPLERCTHTLVAAQAARQPHALALAGDPDRAEDALCYGDLNRRANQLAHYLRANGFQPGDLAAVYLDRSPALVISLLAILKAGGAYVPVDTTYPPDRLAFMIEDTQVSFLLTSEALRPTLPITHLIALDTDWPGIAQESEQNLTVPVTADHLAYVIYTSGSTGRPKGVPITHGALLNLIHWHQRAFAVTAADRATLLAGVAFDASVWELWPYLTAGASIHIPDETIRTQPPQLREWLVDQQITHTFLPTPLAEQVLLLEWPPRAPLRFLLTGGDKLQRPPAPGLPFTLVNNYGPTENTVVTTSGPITAHSAAAGAPPIGRPIDNTQLYVLDRWLQPVPVGVIGELYISGVGLSPGYWQRPGRTAAAFIPHPFSPEPGQRLYKTGDLVRYLADGAVAFIGRSDTQVKVRGFRIELGEIEARLTQHTAVQASVTTLYTTPQGEKQLVAYVVPHNGQQIVPGDLRPFLKETLPAYMIPTSFVTLAAFPLTPNGKIDRQALPAPDRTLVARAQTFVAPRTEIERQLAALWAQLLGVAQVGVYDNFFELGGHSLLATQLIAQMRQHFAVDLPLRHLFETATVAALAQQIEQAQADETQAAAAIPAIPRDRELPLSFAQQRLWFLEELEPNLPTYNVPLPLRLTGPLDVTALQAALTAVCQRHETLRTTFAKTEAGDPVQQIHDTLAVDWTVTDLRQVSPAAHEAQATALAHQEAERPFDLEAGPLLRVSLIQLADTDHILVLTMHHIISDAWSINLLLQELTALYVAHTTDTTPTLPPLPIQYADFAAWQRTWLQGEVLQEQLTYWRQQLQGAPDILALPTDHTRPAVQTFRGAAQSFRLSPTLSKAWQSFSREAETTLFITTLAAFQVLLYRYSGQDDIVVGSPIANRHHPDLQQLIGFFVNTLVLRGDLSGNPSFRTFLQQIRERVMMAQTYQDVPFERLVEELQPKRDMSRTPLFQVLFVLQHQPPAMAMQMETGLSLTPVPVTGNSSKFDLTLFITETQQGLNGLIEYSTDLFTAETIERVWGHFEALLAGIVAEPDKRVDDFSLVTAVEQRLLHQWNDTQVSFPVFAGVHHLFEAQAKRTPTATAVVFEGQGLTYEALDKRANQLAHHLQKLGIGPDVPVGIYMERSVEMVVGILAAVKAGGAYLPLDPAYPAERLNFMVADAQVPVLLTQQALAADVPPAAAAQAHIIYLDSEGDALLAPYPESAPPCPITGDNLLYIMYTSGSTGQPKGVAMRHEPLINLIQWQMETTALKQPARTLQFAPISFDVSCQELFFTWHSGGTLVLLPEVTRRDTFALLRFLDEAQIERLFLPFIALQHLAEAADAVHGRWPSVLQEVITAGEQLQVTPQIVRFFQAIEGCVLHNQYGPTESHVATAYTLTGSPESWGLLPPIGQPVANAEIHLLDSQLRPVPVGIAGEIYIGGDILARGYLNRPDLTAERFIYHRLPGDAQPRRLYKTGDLGRYRPDGNIEYFGRNDFQVKVRGYRIEPAEIEVVVSQHPAVQEAVVVARDDSQGNKQLVAYVVGEAETADLSSAIRAFLRDQMPDYMIPAHLMVVDHLPLTPSGKIDRKSLPAPDVSRSQVTTEFVAPRDTLELRLSQMWQDVLNVYPIGIRDSFFELGGHSLLAVRLLARMQKEVKRELPLTSLFVHPTIEQLAVVLRQEAETLAHEALVPIRPSGTKPPLFLVHPGGGHIFPYITMARYLQDEERPIYGLQAVGLSGTQPAHTTIEAMAAHYLAAVRRVQPQGPYWLGGWSMGGTVALEMAQQLQADGEEAALVVLIDTSVPLAAAAAEAVAENTQIAFWGFARDLGLSPADVEGELAAWAPLSSEQKLAAILQTAQRRQKMPGDITLAQISHLFHIFQTNYEAMLAYVARPYNGRVALLQAQDEERGETADGQNWQAWVTGQLAVYPVPGNHFTIVRQPHIQTTVQQLDAILAQT